MIGEAAAQRLFEQRERLADLTAGHEVAERRRRAQLDEDVERILASAEEDADEHRAQAQAEAERVRAELEEARADLAHEQQSAARHQRQAVQAHRAPDRELGR